MDISQPSKYRFIFYIVSFLYSLTLSGFALQQFAWTILAIGMGGGMATKGEMLIAWYYLALSILIFIVAMANILMTLRRPLSFSIRFSFYSFAVLAALSFIPILFVL